MASVRDDTRVPFVDLEADHAPIRAALLDEFSALLQSGLFVNGPAVARFEGQFAAHCRRRHAVGVASGLDALRLALVAGGLERGDEVIVPAQTFVATAEAVIQAGGEPVLADIDEADYCLDASAAAAAVTFKTRVVLPVHLYGQLADLQGLEAVVGGPGIDIVEDACQAHGASRNGRIAGGSGRSAAFSFYPAKNLGALGDAGACVTDDPALAERVRALREHGGGAGDDHPVIGYTSRLDTLQAAALLHKLPLLEGWNAQRREVAQRYGEALDGVGDLRLPPVAPDSDPAWHLYVVRTARPERLAAFLRERGIATGRHYPKPIHLTRAYEHLGRPGAFPVAEALAAEGISLPIFPSMTEEQGEAVVTGIQEYFAGS